MQVVLIGCGNMGGALLRGWVAAAIAPIAVVDPKLDRVEGAEVLAGLEAIADLPGPLCIVLAVKPAMIAPTLTQIAAYLDNQALVISVAAGVSLSTLRRCAGLGPAVVRTMPNTPAAIGRGAVAAVPDAPLTPAQQDFVQTLLQAAGEVFWLEDEGLIDAVTAVSGSGPAYFYRFTELLAQTGRDLGLSAEMAESLATLTFTGAAALLDATGKPAAQLRVEVTSPNGVTAAALAEFDREDRLATLINQAGQAAVKRNQEMGAGEKGGA
jgi:pyrroline-5-carboxylate reductase